jgi:hypothetical protein
LNEELIEWKSKEIPSMLSKELMFPQSPPISTERYYWSTGFNRQHTHPKIKAIESKGMILMTEDAQGKLVFVTPASSVKNGVTVR